MAFAWGVRKSATKLASVCGRVRSISAVVNRPSLALNPSPLSHLVSRGFLYTMAVDQLTSEQTLLLVIDSELNSALQTDDPNLEEEMDLGSFPFRIEDDPGDQSVTMTRDYNEEHIEVSLGMPYLGADVIDAFGTRKDELSFPLVVTVTKKSGLSLEFTCEAYADYIDLTDLTVNYPEDSLEYLMETDWPRFKNLDDNLKKAFQRYLATRVETSTVKLLHKYMMSKIKREYLIWLKNVKKFVDE
ncbi:Mitochondrial glycoprotein [Arabidopsis suecica]|uniref:Mitochondrial glycoprotein n=1 Tax=Arabidopsis suecica TaxID=45249 RepID=A0A8T2AMS0_ARASU|nr:Mitochondrial glycoprotein [Arabidopsis suecica]